MQKIASNLWFNGQAEEAVNYYTSIFKQSGIGKKSYYGKAGFEYHHKPEGTVMTIEFEIEGQKFLALNAGPEFKFNEAVSFIVNCNTQEEVDYYWDKLSAGGDPNAQMCGWLKDKYGLSWQIVPTVVGDFAADPDAEKVERVMNAIFTMKKMDIKTLEQAYKG
ncbi:VOC family protein [Pedobacter lusitanus]|nr:VOC family protein [Pedobacter lusitanus]